MILECWDILMQNKQIESLLTHQQLLHASMTRHMHESHIKYQIKEIEQAHDRGLDHLSIIPGNESAFFIREDLVIDRSKKEAY